jgi:hypothetical protein
MQSAVIHTKQFICSVQCNEVETRGVLLSGWGKYMTGFFESEADRLNWCHQAGGEVHDTRA